MTNFNSLIKDLKSLNFKPLTNEEKKEKQNRIYDDMHSYLKQAEKQSKKAQRAYGLAKFGNILGKALLPLGVLLSGVALLTGTTGASAKLFSGVGLGYGATGAALQYFFCSDKRLKELKTRAEKAEEEYSQAHDYLENI